jgi:F-type H+-transporting ATPase subunit b
MLDFSVTFVITIINLTILFFILRAVLFKPVTKFMEERSLKIRNDIDNAEKDKAHARLLVQQYEDKLKEADGEALVIIKGAREQAAVQAEKIVSNGKDEAAALLSNAHKQIEAEQKAAIALFKAEAAALIISASSRLLQRDLNDEDSRRFASLLLQELGK